MLDVATTKLNGLLETFDRVFVSGAIGAMDHKGVMVSLLLSGVRLSTALFVYCSEMYL